MPQLHNEYDKRPSADATEMEASWLLQETAKVLPWHHDQPDRIEAGANQTPNNFISYDEATRSELAETACEAVSFATKFRSMLFQRVVLPNVQCVPLNCFDPTIQAH